MWRMTLGIRGEEDGGSRLPWRRAGWGSQRGNGPAETVMSRMACPSRQQAPMEVSAHKPQCSGCKRQLRGTVEQSFQNGTCKHMQMTVHSEINTALKAALTLRILTDVRSAAVRFDETCLPVIRRSRILQLCAVWKFLFYHENVVKQQKKNNLITLPALNISWCECFLVTESGNNLAYTLLHKDQLWRLPCPAEQMDSVRQWFLFDLTVPSGPRTLLL